MVLRKAKRAPDATSQTTSLTAKLCRNKVGSPSGVQYLRRAHAGDGPVKDPEIIPRGGPVIESVMQVVE